MVSPRRQRYRESHRLRHTRTRRTFARTLAALAVIAAPVCRLLTNAR
jgi:hypothetical protein